MALRAIVTGVSDPAWVSVVHDAIAEWSNYVVGDADVRIELQHDASMRFLGYCTLGKTVHCGYSDGFAMHVPGIVARLQGWSSPDPDTVIKINPSFSWSFGPNPEPGKYWAKGVMMHEIGHAMYCLTDGNNNSCLPYFAWNKTQPRSMFTDLTHFNDVVPGPDIPLMSGSIPTGVRQTITDFDLTVASQSGVPILNKPSRIYLIPGGRVVGGSGQDTAVWLNTFNNFNCSLVNVERLEMPSPAALTQSQANIYRLYRAAFGRMPDWGGYCFWVADNRPIWDMAAAMAASPEFQAKYAGKTRDQTIFALYQNILGRDPDQGGYDYWRSRTDLTLSQLVAYFALSDENVIGVPTFSL